MESYWDGQGWSTLLWEKAKGMGFVQPEDLEREPNSWPTIHVRKLQRIQSQALRWCVWLEKKRSWSQIERGEVLS